MTSFLPNRKRPTSPPPLRPQPNESYSSSSSSSDPRLQTFAFSHHGRPAHHAHSSWPPTAVAAFPRRRSPAAHAVAQLPSRPRTAALSPRHTHGAVALFHATLAHENVYEWRLTASLHACRSPPQLRVPSCAPVQVSRRLVGLGRLRHNAAPHQHWPAQLDWPWSSPFAPFDYGKPQECRGRVESRHVPRGSRPAHPPALEGKKMRPGLLMAVNTDKPQNSPTRNLQSVTMQPASEISTTLPVATTAASAVTSSATHTPMPRSRSMRTPTSTRVLPPRAPVTTASTSSRAGSRARTASLAPLQPHRLRRPCLRACEAATLASKAPIPLAYLPPRTSLLRCRATGTGAPFE